MNKYPLKIEYYEIQNLLLSLLLLSALSNKLFAISALPYPIIIKQADNTEITIRLVGDEFFHYTQTTDGLLIQRNDKDIFEYADLSSDGTLALTGIKANDVTKSKKTTASSSLFLNALQRFIAF